MSADPSRDGLCRTVRSRIAHAEDAADQRVHSWCCLTDFARIRTLPPSSGPLRRAPDTCGRIRTCDTRLKEWDRILAGSCVALPRDAVSPGQRHAAGCFIRLMVACAGQSAHASRKHVGIGLQCRSGPPVGKPAPARARLRDCHARRYRRSPVCAVAVVDPGPSDGRDTGAGEQATPRSRACRRGAFICRLVRCLRSWPRGPGRGG